MSPNGVQGCDHQESSCAEEGPQPMRDRKPCKTNPNGADQFWQWHQAEYEARAGRSPPDPVRRARSVCAAYPALRDELARRRSTARVVAVTKTKRANLNFICKDCRNMMMNTKISRYRDQSRNISKRNYTRGRAIKKKAYRHNREPTNYGKYKPSSHHRRANYRYNKDGSLKIYNSCSSVEKLYQAKASDGNAKHADKKATRAADGASKSSFPLNKKQSGSDAKSMKYPSTSENTLSSYHSYSSMEHEPMVS